MKYQWKLNKKDWITRESMEDMLEKKIAYEYKNANANLSDAIEDIKQLLEIIDSLYDKLLGKN
jgi:hypothetical protein